VIVDHGQSAILGQVDVALDEIDAQLDGGPKGRQRVLRELVGVAPMPAEQDAATAQPDREGLRDAVMLSVPQTVADALHPRPKRKKSTG